MIQLAKELHRPINTKFKRRRVITKEIDEIWSADLVDMNFCIEHNGGYRYILTVVDCFSRFAWAEKLKNKNAQSVTTAFENILASGRHCQKLWVDQGSEFYNKTLKKVLDKFHIEIYSSFGDHKSAFVERFNRTLKEKMWYYFTAYNTRKWTDILPKLISTYNSSVHRSIKMTPIDASKTSKSDDVLYNMTNVKEIKKVKPKLNTGDLVRISRIKGTFEKGAEPNWSRELFKVKTVLNTTPVTYNITEYDGTDIIGAFYEQELQKTDGKNSFLVEEVLKTRTVNKKKEYFVKFLGWNSKYNKWITQDDLNNTMT